ncbi:MAG: hypothetical protein HYT22_01515 [Candidatus Niyogibacteria bacterium]|nr:hypothetical protein [Candidatus Niyogibacteria bacterium]
MQPQKLGILFDAGGCLGANTVGPLRAAEERGFLPAAYHEAASVGGLTASKLTELGGVGSRKIEKQWLDVEANGPGALFSKYPMFTRGLFGFFHELFPQDGRFSYLFSNAGIRNLVAPLDCRAIIDSPVRLDIAVWHERTQCRKFFSNRDALFRGKPELWKQVILAATAIQGFLPAIPIDGEYYSDGHYISLQRAFAEGCDTVFVFLNTPKSRTQKDFHPEKDQWLRRALRTGGADQMVVEEFRRFRHAKKEFQRVIFFRSSWLSPTHTMIDFHRGTDFERGELGLKGDITLAIEHSYESALRVFQREFPKEI